MIIAIHNYGRERKRDVELGQDVFAYKIGGPVLAACLLNALEPLARHVKVARQGTYFYIQVHDDARSSLDNREGFLTFTIPDERLVALEALTRANAAGRRIFRWDDDNATWLRFPDKDHPDYYPADDNRAPSFTPHGRATLQTTDYIVGNDLKARRSQRTPEDEPWWWISGDTYTNATTLRSAGCRWSKKRREWYYIGQDLPGEVRALFGDDARMHNLIPTEATTTQSVPETKSTLITQPTERPSTDSPTSSQTRAAFDVAIANTSDPDSRARLELGREYFTNPEFREAMSEAVFEATTAQEDRTPNDVTSQDPPTPASPEAIWQTVGDDVIQWQRKTPISGDAPQEITHSNGIFQLPMKYIGQITVAGQCHVFGLALNSGVPVYLNITGPSSAVEAIWARLAQGKELYLPLQDHHLNIPLQPTDKGAYHRFQRKLGTLSTEHMILVHQDLITPEYKELSNTYIIRVNDEQFAQKLGQHVNALLKIPVFPDWYPYLTQIAEQTGTARRIQCYGGIDIWVLTLDQARWTQTISLALEQGALRLPGNDQTVTTTIRQYLDQKGG